MVLRKKLETANCEKWQKSFEAGRVDELRLIGGLDVSTAVGDHLNAIGCLAVLSFPDLQVVHSICEHVLIDAPYVAGYLAFREGPVMIALVERLRKERPDLKLQALFVDGNGLLHPDRFGLACHVGVALNVATVGVAKELHTIEGLSPIERTRKDELAYEDDQGRTLGVAVRTKNPIFVSVGHRIDLETAVKLTISCSRHRVPEPIRAADLISREHVRRQLL